MKVYILYYQEYDDFELGPVFDTREKAEAEQEKRNPPKQMIFVDYLRSKQIGEDSFRRRYTEAELAAVMDMAQPWDIKEAEVE